MAFQLASILETTAFTFLNEILAEYSSKDGFARTNRWEILITPPTGHRGNNQSSNIFAPIKLLLPDRQYNSNLSCLLYFSNFFKKRES